MNTSAPIPRTLPDLCRQHGGCEDAETGGFIFDTLRLALRVTRELGATPQVPDEYLDRPAQLRASKRGFVVLEVERRPRDVWPSANGKKNKWQVCTTALADQRPEAEKIEEVDDLLRVLAADGEDGPVQVGKYMQDASRRWIRLPNTDIFSRFAALRLKEKAEILNGLAVGNAYKRVNKPFQPEYPGGREWNFGPQLVYPPVEGEHPHWDRILRHCFADLDEPLKEASIDGIATGYDYGLAWLATIVQQPFDRLPYLYFHGEQNGGKSIFHESFSLLTTKGVVSGDRALTGDKDGELENAILVYIEEKSLAQPGVYNKIKQLTTAESVWIRKMYCPPFAVRNSLHFIQCSNERVGINIEHDDTRLTFCYVGPVEDEIPKPTLLQRLKEEAPAFTFTLLNTALPKPQGRLRLPAITTESKRQAKVDSLPPVAPAIADALTDQWTGTAKDLSDWLGCDPIDAKALTTQLAKADPYFKEQGIEVAWRKSNKGKLLTVRRQS